MSVCIETKIPVEYQIRITAQGYREQVKTKKLVFDHGCLFVFDLEGINVVSVFSRERWEAVFPCELEVLQEVTR